MWISEQKMPEGSWKCEKCNNINYPFRTKCNRQNCGADKPAESTNSASPTPEENDQVRCVAHLLCTSKMYFTSFWLLVTYVESTIFELLMLMDQQRFTTFCPFLAPFSCDGFIISFSLSTLHLVNLKLSTVPVSSRTCLRVEKVQSRPALLYMGV